MGQDPNHGTGRGGIHAVAVEGASADGYRVLWSYLDIDRAIATPIIHDGLFYAADLNGVVHCLDAETGARVWTHDLMAPVWAALLLADEKLYVGDEDGMVTVFAAGRTKQLLHSADMGAPIWSSFAAAAGVLYVATSRELWAIRSE
jgi:outer membrane protein assembly factor BamB